MYNVETEPEAGMVVQHSLFESLYQTFIRLYNIDFILQFKLFFKRAILRAYELIKVLKLLILYFKKCVLPQVS